MIPTKANHNELRDGEYYWVRFDTKWEIGKYDHMFNQFRFTTGEGVCGFRSVKEFDPNPITREDRTDRLSGEPLDPQ